MSKHETDGEWIARTAGGVAQLAAGLRAEGKHDEAERIIRAAITGVRAGLNAPPIEPVPEHHDPRVYITPYADNIRGVKVTVAESARRPRRRLID